MSKITHSDISRTENTQIGNKKAIDDLSMAFGAENGARTRDLNLGKVALYQLSYFRKTLLLSVGIAKIDTFFKTAKVFSTFLKIPGQARNDYYGNRKHCCWLRSFATQGVRGVSPPA